MTDINSRLESRLAASATVLAGRGGDGAVGSSSDPVDIVELLFFAYRDFTGDPDTILDDIGFGRAHHRVLHFVTRNPGLRVADLLVILRITKQSLSRVLKQLIDEGYVSQQSGAADRRARLLYPTAAGAALAARLQRLQTERIAAALAVTGPHGEQAVRTFLAAMVRPEDRGRVAALLEGGVDRLD